jgi:hypothetical protein
MNLAEQSTKALLALHAQIVEVLRGREILRSSNNPTGDLAEHLFCRARNLTPESNSSRGVDAVSADGIRYQIKGRRCKDQDRLRQLSAIRNLDEGQFDFLVGVIFSPDYEIRRAALIPYAVVKNLATRDNHTNSHRFLLREGIWNVQGVEDITEELQGVDLG